MIALLPSKFLPPSIPAGFVARPQLFARLDQAFGQRLMLVSAPAGAGKTSLVSAWVRSAHRQGVAFGWLSLDEADNTPARFLEYLMASLEEGGVRLDLPAGALGGGVHAAAVGVLDRIIAGLVHLKREVVLILDDYHLIHSDEVHTALGYLLEHLPERLHLMLLTRSDPPLDLARLRVSGQLCELRMDQLRFSPAEAAALLSGSAGVKLSEAEVAALNLRAEGWAAGLQMAAISLRGREDVSTFVTAFAGSHRFVFDYLLEQVLNQQTPEVREFLLQTSVLSRLSTPLCDAVLGRPGSAGAMLAGLERANLFLTPLDDERTWYRYHHLFSELLRLILEQSHPGLSALLHARASAWYESQGMIPEALHHALEARDMELAARLVSANVLALVEHAELGPILVRMDAVPQALRAAHPWLAVAHAWALAYTGQMARAGIALDQAEQQLGTMPPDQHERTAGHIAAVRAYAAWVHGSQAVAIEQAERAEALLPADELAVRALNLTTLANALTQYGTSPRAEAVAGQALTLARQAGQSHVFMLASSSLAYACVIHGRLHRAAAVCQEALAAADDFQRRAGHPLHAAASVHAIHASILCEWGEVGPALRAAYRGLALGEQWGQADTILLCLLNLANALSLSGDPAAARQALGRGRQLAEHISPWFMLNVDQVELRILLDAGEPSQARRSARAAGMDITGALKARFLLKENRLDEALAQVARALPAAQDPPSLDMLRLWIIQSVAHFLKKDEARALACLRTALEHAEGEGCVSAFVREGEGMERLLRLARARSLHPEFIRRLLAAFDSGRRPAPAPGPAVEPLIAPLSERELEVLQLLNGPLSTLEIAAQLIVSVNTVHTHIKNIYGKLGVHGRSAAVRRALELQLIR